MAEDIMTITPLGAGQEVGRSCHVLEFRGMTILLDCGIHPGHDGLNGLPFLDRIEPQDLDLVLITHFHLDHAASLPYLTERTNFRGRVFMTHPTKAVLRLLLGDYLRLLSMKNAKPEDVLYTETELQNCLAKVECIDYHTTVTVGALSFHALNAGHVLGACMYFLELGGRSVLYTGDYSMEDDRHLMAAEIPHKKPDLLLTESTYGVQVHASRAEREARFTGTVERVVTRGGRCLIPVFALGRAQELLLILDEYWQSHPHVQDVPIWYASKLASRALRVYRTFGNMMNARIRAQMDVSNPFRFRYIQNLKSIDVNSFDDSGPSVVFASPGMLQSGVSRQLFDRWASNPNNGVLIAGYAVEHTLAKEIMAQPKEVVTLEGRRQPLNCLVDYVSFSAHVDFVQNRSFITRVAPRHIVLVHGQKDEMGRLKSALLLQYKTLPETKRPTITMPPNLQEVKLRFARRRSAKVMGRLAEIHTKTDGDDNIKKDPDSQDNTTTTTSAAPVVLDPGHRVQGILVTHNFHSKIVAPEDLATYTPLRRGSVTSKLHVPFAGSGATLELFLSEMFAGMVIRRERLTSDQQRQWQREQPAQQHVKPESSTTATADDEDEPRVVVTTFDLQGLVQIFALLDDDTMDEKSLVDNETTGFSDSVSLIPSPGTVLVRWEASPKGDVLADAAVALVMHAQSSSASVRYTSQPCRRRHARDEDEDEDDGDNKRSKTTPGSAENRQETMASRLQCIHDVLREQFETVEAVYEESHKGTFEIQTDTGLEGAAVADEDGLVRCVVTVAFEDATALRAQVSVESRDEKLAHNVRECVRSITHATQPIQL